MVDVQLDNQWWRDSFGYHCWTMVALHRWWGLIKQIITRIYVVWVDLSMNRMSYSWLITIFQQLCFQLELIYQKNRFFNSNSELRNVRSSRFFSKKQFRAVLTNHNSVLSSFGFIAMHWILVKCYSVSASRRSPNTTCSDWEGCGCLGGLSHFQVIPPTKIKLPGNHEWPLLVFADIAAWLLVMINNA